MNRTTAFTLALLLLTPALAGGAGPNVARPAGTTLNPFGTSVPMTLPVTLADLLRPGSVLTLVTARNVNAGQVRGPTVMLAATSEPATGVVVSRGNEQLRYTFRTPLRAGQSKTLGSVVLLPVPPAVLLPSQAPLPAPLVTPPRPVATPVRPVAPPAAPTVRPAPIPPVATPPTTTPPVATPPTTTPPIATPPVATPPVVTPPVGAVDEPISICHATGSGSNPYTLITVSRSALGAHEGHGDIIPAPAEGCPASADASAPTPPSPTPPTSTPPGQTPPAPTPPAPPENGNDKVDICHATGSASNPYNLISVSRDALGAHEGHGDLIPAPAGGCPAGTPPGNNK